jgi:hypothetical protein
VNKYPEIAELRAVRFRDLGHAQQAYLEQRLMQLPPANFWKRGIPRDRKNQYRRQRAATELRRIQAGHADLSEVAKSWLSKQANSAEHVVIDTDFPQGVQARWIGPEDTTFAPADADAILPELDHALGEWGSQGTLEFMTNNADLVLKALEEAPEVSAKSKDVWGNIGRAIAPGKVDATSKKRATAQQTRKLLELAIDLPDSTMRLAAGRMSSWLGEWPASAPEIALRAKLWLRLWPFAVEITNARKPADENRQIMGDRQQPAEDQLALTALNTPVGYLMSAFLKMCPNLSTAPKPFAKEPLRTLREKAILATGPSRLQVLHHFLSHITYMRRADRSWTDENLLDRLRDGADGNEMWGAVAQNSVLTYGAMRRIGKRMAQVAMSSDLSVETRARLAERIVIRVLVDISENKKSAVALPDVQQMLRLGGDRVRSASGSAIGIFVEEPGDGTPEERFVAGAKPFLNEIWPKEKTLRSKSLADALADLPAKSGSRFAEAVSAVAPFMVPFDCWSLWEFGLFGPGDPQEKTLRDLANAQDAEALLNLLDLSIGAEERATVPYDLDRALSQIAGTDPALERDLRFRRLSALVVRR